MLHYNTAEEGVTLSNFPCYFLVNGAAKLRYKFNETLLIVESAFNEQVLRNHISVDFESFVISLTSL